MSNISKKLAKENLRSLTPSEIVETIHFCWFNNNSPFSRQILKAFEKNWIWEPLGNMYLPESSEKFNNGVILEFNPKI